MSELDGVLAVAADNTAGVFGLSADTLAVLFFALEQVENYEIWKDFADEQLSDSDRDAIDRLVGVATYEVMNMVSLREIGEIALLGGGGSRPLWLPCDGAAVSRTTYAALFAQIGTKYGAGNGTTTFNVPNMGGRSPVGIQGGSPEGTAYGAGSVVLVTGQLPAHSHTINDPGHAHLEQVGSTPAYLATGGTGRTGFSAVTTSNTTRVTTDSQGTGITVNNTGSGASVDLYHPVRSVPFYIYAGV